MVYPAYHNTTSMKNTLIIAIFLLLSNLAKTQDYQKFIREDARWIVYENITEFPDTTRYDYLYLYYFKGDTLIKDTNYHKLYRSNLKAVNNNYQPPYSIINNTTILNAVLREDEEHYKVYGYFIENDIGFCPTINDWEQEMLFYDFQKVVGDTLRQCNIEWNRRRVDEIHIGSEFANKKSFYFLNSNNDPLLLYTEGIGAVTGPIGYAGWVEYTSIVLENYCIIGEDDCGIINSISANNVFAEIKNTPNPFHNFTTITNAHKINTLTVKNLQGQEIPITFNHNSGRLSFDSPAGIYLAYITTQDGLTTRLKLIKNE